MCLRLQVEDGGSTFIPSTSNIWQFPYHIKHNGTLTSKQDTMNIYRVTQVSLHTALTVILNIGDQYQQHTLSAIF